MGEECPGQAQARGGGTRLGSAVGLLLLILCQHVYTCLEKLPFPWGDNCASLIVSQMVFLRWDTA